MAGKVERSWVQIRFLPRASWVALGNLFTSLYLNKVFFFFLNGYNDAYLIELSLFCIKRWAHTCCLLRTSVLIWFRLMQGGGSSPLLGPAHSREVGGL